MIEFYAATSSTLAVGRGSTAKDPVMKTRNSGDPFIIFSSEGPIIKRVIFYKASSAESIEAIAMSPKKFVVYEDDPEIAAMSRKELKAALEAAFGAWADRDDINDEWLDNLSKGWSLRFDELYGNEEPPKISS